MNKVILHMIQIQVLSLETRINKLQTIATKRNLHVIVLTVNPKIDQRIALIVVAPQTLLTLATKEVVADAALGGVCVNRTMWQVIRTGVDRNTPGDIFNAVSIKHSPYPVPIGILATSPPCGLRGILQVAKKWISKSPGFGGNTQKLDAVVDRRLSDDMDSASIVIKIIVHKLSDDSSDDLYLRCRMKFTDDIVQTQAPQFMDVGAPGHKHI